MWRRDLRVLGQQVEEGAAGPQHLAADVVDEVVRALAAERRPQPHHHRLGDHQPLGRVQVRAHPRGIDLQALEDEPALRQGAGRQDEDLGQHDPLDLPGAGRALVVRDHRVEQGRHVLAHDPDAGVDVGGGDRVALLRHGAGRAAALGEGLEDLLDLGLHHQLDVRRHLAERAGDQAEEAADLGDPVAHRVPGDLGLAEAELLHQPRLDLEAPRAERGEVARGAAELADQHARAQLPEPLEVALEAGEEDGRLVAEGDRHRLLQVAARRHRRVPVAAGEPGERAGDRQEIPLDQVERVPDLQHGRGVGDVLGRGAPVAPLAEPVPAQPDQLLHDGEHGVADPLGLGLQLAPGRTPRRGSGGRSPRRPRPG